MVWCLLSLKHRAKPKVLCETYNLILLPPHPNTNTTLTPSLGVLAMSIFLDFFYSSPIYILSMQSQVCIFLFFKYLNSIDISRRGREPHKLIARGVSSDCFTNSFILQ